MFQKEEKKAVKRVLQKGNSEIENARFFLKYFTWQKEQLPPTATKEDIAKIDLKIQQTRDALKTNEDADARVREFIATL